MSGLARFFLAAGIVLAACAGQAKTKHEAADEAAISKALQDSAAAWSRGDLAAFMTCYENSSTTEYVKATGVVEGYTAIHDMYASRYGSGGAGGFGRLSLELTNYRQMGAAYALVTGRFALARPKAQGGDATGIFTLVFHRSVSGWHIMYDHSS
jgi:ketosteroid isomerase-like protein